MMYSVGADIGGSHISTALFEHGSNTIRKESVVKKTIDKQAPLDEILSAWADAIRDVRNSSSLEITGVGIAMPGPFNYYDGISLIKGVNKLESLYCVNVKEELARRLDLPVSKIRFINDAIAFAVAESRMGEARNFTRCVGLTLGTGFGSAFLQNGRPVITRDDVPVGGYLYDKFFKGKRADDIFSTRGIVQRYYEHTGILMKNVLDIVLQAEENDDAKNVLLDFGNDLGEFLAPYIENFRAETIALGGNISKAFPLFEDTFKRKLPNCHLYASEHGERAAMIGAAQLLDEAYYAKIENTLRLM